MYIGDDDTEFLQELNAYSDIKMFIYDNWDAFTKGAVRSNYAFSDALPTNITPVATQAPPTPPAKRGRPKKVQTASQPSTATTSTPKVKKKIDEVKTADDLIDLDLDDLEI